MSRSFRGNDSFIVVEFLPSEEGSGFESSIYRPSASDNVDEFWRNRGYDDLRGVAVAPTVEMDEWQREVYNRLKSQGVVFLTPDEAKKYKRYLANRRAKYMSLGRMGRTIMSMIKDVPLSEEETKAYLSRQPDLER